MAEPEFCFLILQLPILRLQFAVMNCGLKKENSSSLGGTGVTKIITRVRCNEQEFTVANSCSLFFTKVAVDPEEHTSELQSR